MTCRRGAGPWWHYLGVTVVCVLGGCGLLADEPPSVVAQSEPEVVMSGGYVVGEDGKLEKPNTNMVVHPVTPSAGWRQDKEGAVDFAQYYVQLLAYGWNSGDVAELSMLRTEECSFCIDIEAEMEEMYASGGWIEGLQYVVIEHEEVTVVGPPTLPQDTYVVVMSIQATPHVEYLDGKLKHNGSAEYVFEVQAVPTGERWAVTGAVGQKEL